MAGTIQVDQIISSNRNITVDDVAVRSYAGGGGAFNFRNKIVDGRFDFWYEGTSTTGNGYGAATMWRQDSNGSTKVVSQKTLTPGVDLPAIECPTAKYFHRTVVSSVAGTANYTDVFQTIEDVRTLAGKQVTLSFYAKADSAKSISTWFNQHFGTTGSAVIGPICVQMYALTTSWKRYVATFTLPSITGKTIVDGSFLSVCFGYDLGSNQTQYGTQGNQSGTFDIACVQLEEGSVATPFEELPIEVSEMRVNRYYQRLNYASDLAVAYISTDTATTHMLELRSIMRGQPTCSVVRINGTVKCITAAGAYTAYTPSRTDVSYVTNTHFLLQFAIAAAAAYSAYVSQFNGYVIADARL